MKQEVLAQKVSMSQANLSNIERNFQEATPQQINDLAAALEIPAERLTINVETQSNSANGSHNVVNNPISEGELDALKGHVNTLKQQNLALKEEVLFLRNLIQGKGKTES